MKILLDTNVILDALASRHPWSEEAERILLLAADQTVNAYITANSTTDIYYLLRKHTKNNEITKKHMNHLFVLFSILDVISDDCTSALHSQMTDYEDAIISICANRHEIDYIVTRNIKDFRSSYIPAITPNEFLKNI